MQTDVKPALSLRCGPACRRPLHARRPVAACHVPYDLNSLKGLDL